MKLEIVNADVHTYCLTTGERFDCVLFLGLFYHLKYPGLVLDRLAEMTKERFVLQSHSIGPAATRTTRPTGGSRITKRCRRSSAARA